MTVKIEALIHSLGKPWFAIQNAGVIDYKTPPKGTQSDEYLTLDMKREGVYLSFENNRDKTLAEISLELKAGSKNSTFPSELPDPLKSVMTREWVHQTFGEPAKSTPPEIFMKRSIGWIERYSLKGMESPTTMVFHYDTNEIAEAVTFLPTSKLRW